MEYVPGRAANTGISRVWAIMDQIVLYIFTLEVVIKVVAEGLAPWRCPAPHHPFFSSFMLCCDYSATMTAAFINSASRFQLNTLLHSLALPMSLTSPIHLPS